MKKLALSRAKEWQDTTPEQLRDRLPIRVISLARIHARRQTVLTHLQAAGIRFEVFDAIDGKNASPIFDSTVAKYIQGIRLDLWKRQHPHHRKKVAVDISHYVNLHRISKEGQPALIIEDDARIPSTLPSTRWDSVEPAVGNSSHAGRWYAALLAALQELPEVRKPKPNSCCINRGEQRVHYCRIGMYSTLQCVGRRLAQLSEDEFKS